MATTNTTKNSINDTSRSPPHSPAGVDRRSGFCFETKTFRSLRPAVALPPAALPVSFPSFALSLLPSPLPSHPALLDAATGDAVSFPAFASQVRALAASLRSRLSLSRGDVAFVLAPARLDVPVLYFAALSVGVAVSPANPASTAAEVGRLVGLSKPSVAFSVSCAAAKIPPGLPTVLLDSPQFESFLHDDGGESLTNVVYQSDVATIQYTSGTTGLVKAAALPHRSFIAMAAGQHALRPPPTEGHDRMLLGAPMFHSMGFFFVLRGLALGETTVLLTAPAGVRGLLEAAERYKVMQMTAAPPVVVAMAKGGPAATRDLSALERVVCGGAPLPAAAAEAFRRRFPRVELCMSYGSTEAGGISRMIGPSECSHLRSVGRVSENVEVKLIDPVTGKSLSVGEEGELYVKGPAIMTGYVGDDEANAATFDSDGWLRTGDLCYIDHDGFVFIVDRLKELIKYKAYQVPPAELEHVLQSLPEIIDAAVMPYPHEEAGQIPMALVVRQPGSKVTEDQVMDYVAKKVAPYKKIRKVVFVDLIPKSPSGKILRRQLSSHLHCGSLSRL